LFHIEDIKESAAEKHLKNLCFKCHLGYEKKHYAATDESSRGGGCLACHLSYPKNTKPNINDNIHPNLSLKIGNEKCFGCHSRSNRISTNYEGWFETLHTADKVKDSTGYRILKDKRVFGYAGDDVHHQAGLLCIDCHTSQEVMGDGHQYKHQEEALKIQCKDCHTQEKHKTININNLDKIAALDYALQGYKRPSSTFIITEKDSIPLVNTFFDEKKQAFLVSKINQSTHAIPKSCKKDEVHNNLDCNMCHTSWAPSCIGCHTSYDNSITLRNGKKGKWIEMIGGFGYTPPVMGVKHTKNSKTITPAIPGMIMSLDKSGFHGEKKGTNEKFLRLFAPIYAHTTSKTSRTCVSCHNNSEALGFGKGKLTYTIKKNKGYWTFEAAYEKNLSDKLPQDAWNGFLSEINNSKKYSAHSGFLPLDLDEQKKILQVGACLHCHKNDTILQNKMIYGDYQNLLKQRKKDCILPF